MESTLQSNVSYIQQEVENLKVRDTQNRREDQEALGLSSEVLQNVGLQSSCEAKDIFQPPRVKKLYPQLPAETVGDIPALVAVKPLLRNERLYPELPSQPEIVTLSTVKQPNKSDSVGGTRTLQGPRAPPGQFVSSFPQHHTSHFLHLIE